MCLLSFLFDVSANCACDLELRSATGAMTTAIDHADSDADPCSGSCVPDCCCCTPSLPAAHLGFELSLQPIAGFYTSGNGEPSPGIALVPYRPPSYHL